MTHRQINQLTSQKIAGSELFLPSTDGTPALQNAFQHQSLLSQQVVTPALIEREDLYDQEMREAYMESCVEQDIAWQIRINRANRNMTQKDLASSIGSKQSAIARWEDPAYGSHSIPSLVKIANAFGCALVVRFAPYSKFLEMTKDTSDDAYLVRSYDDELKEIR